MSTTPVSLPSRAATGLSTATDDAIPDVDPSTTAGLLSERLKAWKHVVAYLEEYVESLEKIHKAQAKEYEKSLKLVSRPLREGHHFDPNVGGVTSFFENIRLNTQAMINSNLETEKAIKTSVLPILERLHKEIKVKAKEVEHGAQKGAKEVDKAQAATQKHIELLGQQTASFESAGGQIAGHDDPYVVRRGVLHRLTKQVQEENNYHNELVSVQGNFGTFETHLLTTLQQALETLSQLAGGQGETMRQLFADIHGTIQCIPKEYEWTNFTQRYSSRLVDPKEPPRVVSSITFPNMSHASTQPLLEGSLERKSRNKLSWGVSTGYYVVTPSKFLHEFKDSDDARQDPKPELSIYLPDAVLGTPSGDKFTVKGKDVSKTVGSRFTGSSELNFKAHTPADAEKWFETLRSVTTASGARVPSTSPSATPGSLSPSSTGTSQVVPGTTSPQEAVGTTSAAAAGGATGVAATAIPEEKVAVPVDAKPPVA